MARTQTRQEDADNASEVLSGEGEKRRWREGEMERRGDGEKGRWGEGEMERKGENEERCESVRV